MKAFFVLALLATAHLQPSKGSTAQAPNSLVATPVIPDSLTVTLVQATKATPGWVTFLQLGGIALVSSVLAAFFAHRLAMRQIKATQTDLTRQLEHSKSLANAAEVEAKSARRDSLVENTLRLFEGGTQNRIVGIAIVQAHWGHAEEEQRSAWAGIFVRQVIYLLADADAADKRAEHANLLEMVDWLCKPKVKGLMSSVSKENMRRVILEARGPLWKRGVGLGSIPSDVLDRWVAELATPGNGA